MIIVRLDGLPDDQIFQVDSIFSFNNFVSHVTSKFSAVGGWPRKIFVQCPEILDEEWQLVQGVDVNPGMSPRDIQRAFSGVQDEWRRLDARADIVNEVRENPSCYAMNPLSEAVGNVVNFEFRMRNKN